MRLSVSGVLAIDSISENRRTQGPRGVQMKSGTVTAEDSMVYMMRIFIVMTLPFPDRQRSLCFFRLSIVITVILIIDIFEVPSTAISRW